MSQLNRWCLTSISRMPLLIIRVRSWDQRGSSQSIDSWNANCASTLQQYAAAGTYETMGKRGCSFISKQLVGFGCWHSHTTIISGTSNPCGYKSIVLNAAAFFQLKTIPMSKQLSIAKLLVLLALLFAAYDQKKGARARDMWVRINMQ